MTADLTRWLEAVEERMGWFENADVNIAERGMDSAADVPALLRLVRAFAKVVEEARVLCGEKYAVLSFPHLIDALAEADAAVAEIEKEGT